MKKLLTILVIAGVVGGGIAIAMRKKTRPGPVKVSDVPPGLPGAVDFNLPEGWTVYGWYTYQGNSAEKLWIRVDKGPAVQGTIVDDQMWRWSIFVDRADASGYVPIATGEKTWKDLSTLMFEVESYQEDFGRIVARAAANQIDEMYPEPQEAVA